MEAITVVILALLGIVGGRNILLLKEEDHLQISNQELSRHPTLDAKRGEHLETVDVPYPEQQSNENFIDNKILAQVFKEFDDLPAIKKALVKHDTKTTEAKEDDVSSVKAGEDDNMMDGSTKFEDRQIIAVNYCVNGTIRVGDSCWPVV